MTSWQPGGKVATYHGHPVSGSTSAKVPKKVTDWSFKKAGELYRDKRSKVFPYQDRDSWPPCCPWRPLAVVAAILASPEKNGENLRSCKMDHVSPKKQNKRRKKNPELLNTCSTEKRLSYRNSTPPSITNGHRPCTYDIGIAPSTTHLIWVQREKKERRRKKRENKISAPVANPPSAQIDRCLVLGSLPERGWGSCWSIWTHLWIGQWSVKHILSVHDGMTDRKVSGEVDMNLSSSDKSDYGIPCLVI